MSEKESNILTHLRDQIARHFDLEELQALAFELELDWDELPGLTKTIRIQSLLSYLAQQQRLADLTHLLQQKRPAQTWSAPPPPDKQPQLAQQFGQTADLLATLIKHSEETM